MGEGRRDALRVGSDRAIKLDFHEAWSPRRAALFWCSNGPAKADGGSTGTVIVGEDDDNQA